MRHRKPILVSTLSAIFAISMAISPSAFAATNNQTFKNVTVISSCKISGGSSFGGGVGNVYTSRVSSCSQVSSFMRYYDLWNELQNSPTKYHASWAEVSITGVGRLSYSRHGGADYQTDWGRHQLIY